MRNFLNTAWANILFWGVVILAFAAIVATFYFTTYVEGVASLALLIIAVVFLWKKGEDFPPGNWEPLLPILGFAFLGLMFDGAGNRIYNQPIQYLFCPAGTTSLVRDVRSYENHEGDDVAYHQFSCWSRTEGKIVKQVPVLFTSPIRFVEYALIAAVLLAFYWLISGLMRRKT